MKPTTEFLLAAEDAERVRSLVPDDSVRRPLAARHIVMTVAAVVALLALLWLGFANAAGTAGTWKGVTSADVVITFIVKTNGSDAVVKFGAPHRCTLTASLELHKGTTSRYDIRSSNGGACDRFVGERMSVVTGSDASHLTLQLIDNTGKVRETIDLVAAR
ncbi:MAG TPA: hypothetical protein VKB34_18100 [Povalibacter sp.]|nr:hypothetical protein [Povalibacter sp.]